MSEVEQTVSETSLSETEGLPFSLKELLSHTPDIILQRNPDSPVPQTVSFYGVVLFADISGFTALCENYCNESDKSSSGTDQLTTTLNSYLSKIVDAIIRADGDVVKFAGDALLAFWPCSKYEAVKTVQHVIRMCLGLQSTLDKYQTVDGVVLRMKLGVSVGPMEMYHIGNELYKMFDLAGEAVDDVNKAQSLAKSGSVVISPPAWDTCNKPYCFANLLADGYIQILKVTQESLDEFVPANNLRDLLIHEHRKGSMLGLTRNAMSAKKKNLPELQARPISAAGRNPASIEPNPFSPKKPETVSKSSNEGSESFSGDSIVQREILQHHLKSVTPKTEPFIRCYIQKTVVDRVDHGHDASWMSELRKVSVLFVNLDPKEKLDVGGKLTMLQNSFDVIHPVLLRYEGSINKVFMFDKGCTFVCIFGLPHAKHEDDSKRALKAAKHIYHNLEELELSHVSIGVTTGTAFCGVVGHPLRHEYTVIGQKVNMAARLMMKYPNAITCDQTSMKASSISEQMFTLLPPPELKGISQPEDVYSFTTDRVQSCSSHMHELHYSQEHDSLIGRDQEMSVLKEQFAAIKEGRPRDFGIVAFTGSGGMGKTKLLKSAKSVAAEMDFRVVSIVGTIDEQNTPFHVVKTLLSRLLGIDRTKTIHDREQIILDHVTTDEQHELLPLLNDLLMMKYPQTSTTSHLTHKERQVYLHKLLLSLVHQYAQETPCVFGIDNAQFMDEDSWPFIVDLAQDNNTLVVVGLRYGKLKKKTSSKGLKVMEHSLTKAMDLEGLSKEETIALACQLLDAEEIPQELSKILFDKTHGIPLWCEELVSSMIERGLLKVSDIGEESDEERDQVMELKPLSPIGKRMNELLGKMERRSLHRKSVVEFTRSVRPEDISVPDSVTGMILARFDNLSAASQMVLKCAAVLGTAFSREMLFSITPSKTKKEKFNNILSELASFGLIECYYSGKAQDELSDVQGSTTDLCPCLSRKRSRMSMHKNVLVDECEVFEFVHPYVQDTVYRLWTNSQRKQLHMAATKFLESQAHKCRNCGGGGFAALGLPNTERRMTASMGGNRGGAFMGTSTRTAIQRNRRRSTGNWRRNTVVPLLEERPAPRERRHSLIDVLLTEDAPADLPSADSFLFDLQDCHCEEVLSKVYPQLIRHWKEVGDNHKVLHYLTEAGAAAVTMFNNLEALSLLEEAKSLSLLPGVKEELTQHERAELESLIGQALFQSGEVEECLPHFTKAVAMLGGNLPTGNVSSAVHLVKMATRQFFHRKFPQRFIGIKRGLASDNFLDQARCLAHVTHAYHLQHKNWRTLTAALHQLNTAEEAQENFHELIEAYSTMIECCQLFEYHTMAQEYIKKAMKYCDQVQPDVNDLLSYAHFLNVVLNYSLSQGNIPGALRYGRAAISISNKLHEVPIKLASMTLLSQALLASELRDDCANILSQLSVIVEQADDLRAKALWECYTFDAYLESGICEDVMEDVLLSAKKCSHEDVFHYDGEERFCLLAYLALWYARKSEWAMMSKYLNMARRVRPEHMETYLVGRGLYRLVQSELLYFESNKSNRETKKIIKEDMKVFRKLSKKLAYFKIIYQDLITMKKNIEKSF